MGRGIPSGILTQLNAATIPNGFFYLFQIDFASGTVYWDQRGNNDGTHTYTPRIISVSDIAFRPTDTNQVTLTLSNADGAITTLQQNEQFYGAIVRIYQYVPDAAASYIVWTGYLDEIADLGADTATLIAYSDTAGMKSTLPRRQVAVSCPSQFAYTANWQSVTDFDGSECPYNRTSTIGFRCTLLSNILAGDTSLTANIGSTNAGAGMQFIVSDQIIIGTEVIEITAVAAVDGSFHQALTIERGLNGTVPAGHTAGDTILFFNCQKDTNGCTRRGMYGNNPSDTF